MNPVSTHSKQKSLLYALAAACCFFAGVAGWAEVSRLEEARKEEDMSRRLAELEGQLVLSGGILDTVIAAVAEGGAPAEGTPSQAVLRILEAVQKAVEKTLASAPAESPLLRSQAVMLSEFANLHAIHGNPAKRAELVAAALGLFRKRAATGPDTPGKQRDLSVGL